VIPRVKKICIIFSLSSSLSLVFVIVGCIYVSDYTDMYVQGHADCTWSPPSLYCAFSGFGDSTSVMFCGSFHARAMYLLFPKINGQQSQTSILQISTPNKVERRGWMYYSLSMTPPRHELFLLVGEADGSVRECLADCVSHGGVSIGISSFCLSVTGWAALDPAASSILEEQKCKAGREHEDVHLSHVTSARMISPILPPEARYVTIFMYR
jgi:hypothetical protein